MILAPGTPREELEKRACPTVDVKFKTATDKKSHSTAEPPAENKSVMALEVEAGKTYFVEQKIKVGLMKARNKLNRGASFPAALGGRSGA